MFTVVDSQPLIFGADEDGGNDIPETTKGEQRRQSNSEKVSTYMKTASSASWAFG